MTVSTAAARFISMRHLARTWRLWRERFSTASSAALGTAAVFTATFMAPTIAHAVPAAQVTLD